MGIGFIKRRAQDLAAEKTLSRPGDAPGTLSVAPGAPRPTLQLIAFGPEEMIEKTILDPEDAREYLSVFPVVWLNVEGLGDTTLIARIGEVFGLHRLALEDVTDKHQRAKVDYYADHLFFTSRMTTFNSVLETEQLSIFLGTGYVVTFQETPGDCFDPVRERLRMKRGRLRYCGPDYLAYALLDALVDNYFPVLERYGDLIEVLEDEVVSRPSPRLIGRIHELKRDLHAIRRAVWPLREAINALLRDTSPRFAEETRLYLRDCYDHVVQLLEMSEAYRDVATSLMETYLSSVSCRMNEIMKVLTIISTIFIPLSFIASVYGMNFRTLPELEWEWGYPFALFLMSAVAGGLLFYFRRSGWLGAKASKG